MAVGEVGGRVVDLEVLMKKLLGFGFALALASAPFARAHAADSTEVLMFVTIPRWSSTLYAIWPRATTSAA